MAEVEFHLHNEVGIKFPPLRPAYTDGEVYFGRFRCLIARSTGSSIIGEGGTGRIHLVRDELMEREVALKIPLESILRDPAAREDIIQETRQAMDLTHPNIVRIHDFHEGGGKWGISMQYVRGKNLDEWRYESETSGFRRAIRPYTVEAIRDWTAQLCDALRYAHEDARMVHRDIKPKNLMLEKRDGGEKVYITDFGISQRLRQHTMMLSRDQSKAGDSKGNMGTLPYMPWEQISGAAASPLDDIYAVGATIYELITGRPPFYDGGFEQIKVQIREIVPPSMEKRILDLGLHMPPPPDEWEQVVAACLAKRPEDRPQSMRAVAAALGFQSGSNTELEAKVSLQGERINELETQIITLTQSSESSDHQAEAELQQARQQLASLQHEINQAQEGISNLEEMLRAARNKEAEVAAALQTTTAERDAALQGGDAALKTFQQDAAKRIALAEEKLAKSQQDLNAAKSGGDAQVKQAQQAAQQKITELEAKLQAARKEAEQWVLTARKETEQAVVAARKEAEQAARKETEHAVVAARKEAEQAARKEAEQTVQATRKEAEQAVRTAKNEAEQAVRTAKNEAERLAQTARKEAEHATQLATANLRREADQLNEQLRKSAEAKEKALVLARDESEKRLQNQTGELEKSRQHVAKLTQQNDQLKHTVAIEKERQGASLRPLLIGLLVAMVLGLGGGFAYSMLQKSPAALTDEQQKLLPATGKVADMPVPYEVFECFAKALNTSAKELGGLNVKGSIYGINAVTATNFCNWLTDKYLPKNGGDHYALPTLQDLNTMKPSPKTKEWAINDNTDDPTQVLSMCYYEDLKNDEKSKDNTLKPIAVYAMNGDPTVTFRIKRVRNTSKNPAP